MTLPDSSTPVLLDGGASPAGWSRLGTSLKCTRLYGLKYGSKGVRSGIPGVTNPPQPPRPEMSTTSKAQGEGIVIHTGLAHYYALRGIEQSGEVYAADEIYIDARMILDPHAAMQASAAGIEERSGLRIEVDRLSECLEAYKVAYSNDAWKVEAVECVVRAEVVDEGRMRDGEWVDAGWEDGLPVGEFVPYPNGPRPARYLYTARVDLMWSSVEHRESDRRTYIVDHKGAAGAIGAGSSTVRGYATSGQIHGLRWLGQRVFGAQFGGVMLNMIGREPPFRFGRPPLESATAMTARFERTIIEAERRIAEAEMSGLPARDWTPAANETVCVGRYGVCPAWEKKLCQW